MAYIVTAHIVMAYIVMVHAFAFVCCEVGCRYGLCSSCMRARAFVRPCVRACVRACTLTPASSYTRSDPMMTSQFSVVSDACRHSFSFRSVPTARRSND